MKKDIKVDIRIAIIISIIVLLIVGICVFCEVNNEKKAEEEIIKQNSEIINYENTLTNETTGIIEIFDIRKNSIVCFYGNYSYMEKSTYAKIVCKESDYTTIYLVIPGGKIKQYNLTDNEGENYDTWR